MSDFKFEYDCSPSTLLSTSTTRPSSESASCSVTEASTTSDASMKDVPYGDIRLESPSTTSTSKRITPTSTSPKKRPIRYKREKERIQKRIEKESTIKPLTRTSERNLAFSEQARTLLHRVRCLNKKVQCHALVLLSIESKTSFELYMSDHFDPEKDPDTKEALDHFLKVIRTDQQKWYIGLRDVSDLTSKEGLIRKKDEEILHLKRRVEELEQISFGKNNDNKVNDAYESSDNSNTEVNVGRP